ncbi:MAG: hypothetical protein FJ216_01110 [Ignavibacteria bacterium]|nr:hypothetical protein [Ignavibacteria bacterium]
MKKLILTFLIFILPSLIYSQYLLQEETSKDNTSPVIHSQVSTRIFKTPTESKALSDTMNGKIFQKPLYTEKKSSGLALLFSLILPGAGHYYAERMDIGKYFFAGEVASWVGLITMNLYGNSVRDDARSFASVNASFNQSGKNDDYYTNIGSFMNIFEYNNEKLRKGEYSKIYADIEKYYWNWNNSPNKDTYESQRKKSERIYNSRVIFAMGMIINRLASGLSSILIVNKENNKLDNQSIRINTSFIGSPGNPIDGIQISVTKTF